MRFSQLVAVAASQGGGAAASDVDLWAAAVVANGGSVSAGRKTLVGTFIAALKTAGSWALTDDLWILAAENEAQALTSLKQRRLATAVATPTFTADAGHAFNGSSQYLNTGFIPSTHAAAMTGSNMRTTCYERTNVVAAGAAAGTLDTSTRNLQVNPRVSGNFIRFGANSSLTPGAVTVTDSRGFVVGSRSAGPTFSIYKNGSLVETVSPAANATVLPTRAYYIGALNNAGTAASFRASTLGFASVGASLSAGQEADDYAALQTLMTAIGANV